LKDITSIGSVSIPSLANLACLLHLIAVCEIAAHSGPFVNNPAEQGHTCRT
jgi:hypothetical protein